MKIGIIGAMDVEVELLKAELTDARAERVAGTDFCSGRLGEKDVVVVKCGIGKVNAGICAQVLADHFGCTHLINTGVAGSLDAARLDIGDLVVSTDCVQHDFSVGALGYAPGLVPGRERPEYVADPALRDAALEAAAAVAPEVRALTGRVASGDQFISAEEDRRRIVGTFGALCCEMEGAAIAQAAEANGVPFVVVRAISDKPGTDGQAMDYATFERASAERCAKIVDHMVAGL
ncbi:5'-methylthioadenosine/adenosylhomocysteine nucleosidase [Olsenella sp. An290]|uniref:5'-methylthioadenosine/adenosylhomocysteine nucleosidase n=1 Tax=Olsenella sp. An290 TaxID=1965625 RepID=UPI000B3827F5|nr:5'-methylthioadenosine/adenosylhomocysteine nucleosidase [Olsenella sp. An290]OUO35008.1 5'-methylthioadenosine/S-adenosylhomocysteine nucleosidase [Olsenella sp. An290]